MCAVGIHHCLGRGFWFLHIPSREGRKGREERKGRKGKRGGIEWKGEEGRDRREVRREEEREEGRNNIPRLSPANQGIEINHPFILLYTVSRNLFK